MYVPRANDRLRGPLTCADTGKVAAGQNHSCVLYAKVHLAGNGISTTTKKTVQCGGPPQPGSAPKRRRIASLDEDTLTPPPVEPANDNLSRDLRDFVHENWTSVRTHVVHGPMQTRYNHRLTSLDTRELHDPLGQLFDQQTVSFKINCSFGFILKEKTTGRLRYYHSSCNCCGRLLEEPSLITNRADFDSFLERIREPDILQWAIAQRPNSDWVCEHVTNATFFLNKIVQHPIGCVGIALPDYVKNNKAVVGLERNKQNSIYKDNICLFRCLALHKACDVHRLVATVATLYAEYTDMPVRDFAGVKLDDLLKVESKFETNVTVYKLVDTSEETTTAELVRRSECHYPHTMYMNLYKTHYSYIHDIGMYCHSYRCRNCGDSLWKYPSLLKRHELTCEGGIRRVYKGGVYHPHLRYSNAWMMKVSLSPRCCDTTHIAQHLTLNVFSPGITCPLTLKRYNGRHVTYR